MPISFNRSVREGTTVPYAPIFDDIRRNNGFTDLRGCPDLAEKIVEGSSSPALQSLLIRMSRERSYFSLGCDLGTHVEEMQPKSRKNVAGGYIQVASMDYSVATTDLYDRFCDALEKALGRFVEKQHWTINLEGAYVQFKLPDEKEVLAPSIWIWFFAAARTEVKAVESREELIVALDKGLHAEAVRRCLPK